MGAYKTNLDIDIEKRMNTSAGAIGSYFRFFGY